MRKLVLLIVMVYKLTFSMYGQKMYTYVTHYLEENKIEKRILVDTVNKVKFILDSTQTLIIAVDYNYKKIWSTDPWRDNKLQAYRTKRPIIIYFELMGKEKAPGWEKLPDNVIWISYNNSQFGIIDQKTGKFRFLGQD